FIVTNGGCANLGNVLSCVDAGLTNGQSYYYIVSAVNSVGQGAPSNEAPAAPSGPSGGLQLDIANAGGQVWTATSLICRLYSTNDVNQNGDQFTGSSGRCSWPSLASGNYNVRVWKLNDPGAPD